MNRYTAERLTHHIDVIHMGSGTLNAVDNDQNWWMTTMEEGLPELQCRFNDENWKLSSSNHRKTEFWYIQWLKCTKCRFELNYIRPWFLHNSLFSLTNHNFWLEKRHESIDQNLRPRSAFTKLDRNGRRALTKTLCPSKGQHLLSIICAK